MPIGIKDFLNLVALHGQVVSDGGSEHLDNNG